VIFGGNLTIVMSFIKKIFYPVHTPAAFDYIMYNFGEFLSIRSFIWRAFFNNRVAYVAKKALVRLRTFGQFNYAFL
jgi:hypothetical protein